MPRLFQLVLVALLHACAAVVAMAEPVAAPPPLTLPEVFAELRAHHPALAAARANAEAARARIAQEEAWMDPKLTVEHMRGNTSPADYSELKVTYSQEIPFSGRNKLAARAAEAESAVVASQSRRREWMLLNEARTAFVRIAAADERLALNSRLHDLLTQSASLSRQSYETGLLDQMGVLGVETDIARLAAERTELTSLRNQDSARLNALLMRPADIVIAPLNLPEPAAPTLDVAGSVARARAASPEIATALLETEAARARLSFASKNRSIDPEIMVSGLRMKGSGDLLSSYDTGISFSLPWLNPRRTNAARTEARRQLEATRSESAAIEAEIAGMVAASHARAVAAYEQVLRYRDQLVPLSRASVDAARRGYETGQSPLLPVLAAERMALETELKLTDARAEQAIACAELAFLTSQDLTP